MKKIVCALLALALLLCGGCRGDAGIRVISREEGSGTRAAFISLLGIEVKDELGVPLDRTLDAAEQTKDTAVMLLSVSGDPNAIGYVSLGSLNGSVKALRIDGIAPNVETIRTGSYAVARPFYLITAGNLGGPARAFYDYILSAEGQAVVAAYGCVPMENAPAWKPGTAKGKVVVAGSSSVAPLMDQLKDSFGKVNGEITVELQSSDSTTGVANTLEGLCDIGMASRDLTSGEVARGAAAAHMATDGIAVIVHPDNPLDELSKANVRDIFMGEITNWDKVRHAH